MFRLFKREDNMDSVLMAMRSNRKSEKTVVNGCYFIESELQGDDKVIKERRKMFIDKDAGAIIIAAMNAHKESVKVQRRCLASLLKLFSSTNEVGDETIVFQDEIVDAVMNTTRVFQKDERIIYYASVLLADMSRNREKRQELMKRNGDEVVVNAMHNFKQNKDIQEIGCRFVWNLTEGTDNKTNIQRFLQLNADDAIINAMKHFDKSEIVQHQATKALRNIALLEDSKERLIEKDCVFAIKNAMIKFNTHVSINNFCCGLFWILSISNNNDEQTKLMEMEVWDTVITSMNVHKNSKSIQLQGCAVLWNLVQPKPREIQSNFLTLSKSVIQQVSETYSNAIIKKHGKDIKIQDFVDEILIAIEECEALKVKAKLNVQSLSSPDISKSFKKDGSRVGSDGNGSFKTFQTNESIDSTPTLSTLSTDSTIDVIRIPKALEIRENRCKIIDKIGGGAFSYVYRIEIKHKKTDKYEIAAFKQFNLLPNFIKEEEKDAIEREIEILSQLKHENIVNMIGAIGNPNARYTDGERIGTGIVMEYCENGSLRSLLNKNANAKQILNMDLIIHLLIGAAQGLEYLHNHNPIAVLHGDIKSDNILIDKEYNAKLCDFGISKLMQTTSVTQSTTRANAGGTVPYKAPEVFENEIDFKSDVYSFGCVMLEMLTGERPWQGCLDVIIMKYVYNDKKLHDFSKIRADAKEELVNLMKRCLDYDKDKRPTMKEVRMELEIIIRNAVLITLDAKTDEYKKVENLFFPGGDKEGSLNRNKYKIVKIERVRHISAERMYKAELERVKSTLKPMQYAAQTSIMSNSSLLSLNESENLLMRQEDEIENGMANERLLFHGTSKTDPMIILDQPNALMRDYSDVGFYGRGLYFAELARYSNGCRVSNNGEKSFYRYNIPGTNHFQILACSVICGEPHNFGITVSDETRNFSQKDLEGKYHSVYAGPHIPSGRGPGEDDSNMYIIYKDTQVVARYMITYESIAEEIKQQQKQ